MPTLEQRNTDGGYFIRQFYRDHHTWQVVGEGVRFLANRGVVAGSRFSTDLFFELWRKGLVYHGQTIPTKPDLDPHSKTELERRSAEFFRLVFARDADTAWQLIAVPALVAEYSVETSEAAFDRFAGELAGLNLASWVTLDATSVVADIEIMHEDRCVFRSSKLGVCSTRISTRTTSGLFQQDVKHAWFHSDGQWWLLWSVPVEKAR